MDESTAKIIGTKICNNLREISKNDIIRFAIFTDNSDCHFYLSDMDRLDVVDAYYELDILWKNEGIDNLDKNKLITFVGFSDYKIIEVDKSYSDSEVLINRLSADSKLSANMTKRFFDLICGINYGIINGIVVRYSMIIFPYGIGNEIYHFTNMSIREIKRKIIEIEGASAKETLKTN